MGKTIDELLELPSGEAVRRLALALLDEASAAAARIDDASDVEAIHDLRVGLRRLRSLLKLHRGELGGKLNRLRRKLGEVAALTGDARDAEVQLDWLRARKRAIPRTARPALDWLSGRLEERKHAGYTRARALAGEELARLAARLGRRLRRYQVALDEEPGGTRFAAATARLAREQSAALAGLLATVNQPTDEEAAHRARIAGKQARYLVEPLVASRRAGVEATAAVKALKMLQDLLGELHDVHVFARQLDDLAAGSDDRLRRGLSAIADLARARRDELHAELLRERERPPSLEAVAARISPPDDTQLLQGGHSTGDDPGGGSWWDTSNDDPRTPPVRRLVAR
jgi:CHAD domain-containing protein